MLVVLLTGHLDLESSELWDLHGSEFARALREQGNESQLEAAEEACRRRELLRYAGSHRRRYVSPNNLARILLNHFLRPRPDGPDLGPNLMKHTPEVRAEPHHVARRVDAPGYVLDGLPRAEWTMLLEVTRDEGIEGAKRWLRHDQPAMEATYRLPAVAAPTVHELIGMLVPDALKANRGLLATLRFVLEAAMHRKMAWPDFYETRRRAVRSRSSRRRLPMDERRQGHLGELVSRCTTTSLAGGPNDSSAPAFSHFISLKRHFA